MTLDQLLKAFSSDSQFTTLLVLIGADLVLGVLAALKTKTFQVGYFWTFLQDDGIWALAWGVLYSVALVNPGTLLGGYGTFGDVQKLVFGALSAKLIASIVTTLGDLGIPGLANPKLQSYMGGRNPKSPTTQASSYARAKALGVGSRVGVGDTVSGKMTITFPSDSFADTPTAGKDAGTTDADSQPRDTISRAITRGMTTAQPQPLYPMMDGTQQATHVEPGRYPLDRVQTINLTPPTAAEAA